MYVTSQQSQQHILSAIEHLLNEWTGWSGEVTFIKVSWAVQGHLTGFQSANLEFSVIPSDERHGLEETNLLLGT